MATPDFEVITTPQAELAKREKVPLRVLTELFRAGEIDSVVIGGRFRYVILSSWRAYVLRRQLGLERDPREKAAARAAYLKSVPRQCVNAAQRAREAKPTPGRTPGAKNRYILPAAVRRRRSRPVEGALVE